MTKPNFFWILIALPSILGAAAALYLVKPELQARDAIKVPPATVLLDFAFKEPELSARTSLTAQMRQLSKCDDILASTLAKAAGPQTVNKLATACDKLAIQALHGTPTLSVAHLVRARGLHEMGLVQQAEDSLLAAHITGTNEGWLASRRLRLFFDMGLSDNLEIQKTAGLDAMTVLQDANYHSLLPQLYDRFPDFREWLTSAVQDGDAKDLKRFVMLTKERLSLAGRVTE